MTPLATCIVITLLGMWFVPANPADNVSVTKMVLALVFVILAWVLFAIHGAVSL
jgi:hypothetical protein